MKNNKVAFALSIAFGFLSMQADSWLGGTFRGVGRTVEAAGETVGNAASGGAVERRRNREQARRDDEQREREQREYERGRAESGRYNNDRRYE